MTNTTKYALVALVAVIITKQRAADAQTTAMDFGRADDFERPTWGANWISNQWAMINQGQLASTGQIRAGGYL